MARFRFRAPWLLLLLAGCQTGSPSSPVSAAASPSPSASPAAPAAYHAVLSGSAVVPPVDTTASGTGTATPTADGRQIAFSAHVTGLSRPIIHAFVVEGAAGQTGEVVKPLLVSGTDVSGVWSAADAGRPMKPSDLDALRNGGLYFEIATDAHPNGELRGQL